MSDIVEVCPKILCKLCPCIPVSVLMVGLTL